MRRTLHTAALRAAIALLAMGAPALHTAEETLVASWLFEAGEGTTARDGSGQAHGKIVGARWAEGREGSALVFEDYSILDYLKPDVSKATRVVIPHGEKLNPKGSFSLKAHIFPTRDPIYYGGIVEKGRGYEASYRLILLRGLRVRAALGGRGHVVTSAEPVTLNEWHEVEMRREGEALVLLVDGKEVDRKGNARGTPASNEDLVIGERFSGRLDGIELRTW